LSAKTFGKPTFLIVCCKTMAGCKTAGCKLLSVKVKQTGQCGNAAYPVKKRGGEGPTGTKESEREAQWC
jgi:hypothetical protein